MDSPRLCICFLFILNFLVSLTTSQSELRFNRCSESGNYTSNSTYAANLKALLSSIPTSSDLNSDGFFNASIGRNPDQVYAVGLCRGDLAVASCRICLNDTVFTIEKEGRDSGNYTTNSTYARNLNALLSSIPASSDLNSDGFFNASIGQNSNQRRSGGRQLPSCLNDSVEAITQACPNEKEAGRWHDNCMLRFSNRNILGSMDDGFVYVAWNIGNATNQTQLNDVLGNLLPRLRDRAAAGVVRKYAADVADYTSLSKIYALEQCTPDISVMDCGRCLDVARTDVTTYCNGRLGCSSIKPSCVLRYETYEFFQPPADAPPPPPLPPRSTPAPPTAQPPPDTPVNSGNMDQQPDVNEQEVDDVCILQSRQFNVHGGNVHEVPKLGMEFDSEQHAFDYYSEYAHRVGFSVRNTLRKGLGS
ncbi:hypothetical protein RJ639_021033 [Escallonia herrerae]|uniref:Gnk2-homologous domain-containing protein n=1 Tax=Escallonia herrerae TaxID=1293975 RepID=A0AA88V2J7_9ASTE|nr:hypothetical protein RJ639_021033 [Escallonia herrerae]